jgi:hypothetical protein
MWVNALPFVAVFFDLESWSVDSTISVAPWGLPQQWRLVPGPDIGRD